MENNFETLSIEIRRMNIVTVSKAMEFTGKSRAEIISFVTKKGLKIFDDLTQVWINESAIGHC